MPSYLVRLKVTGFMEIEVDADSEAHAIDEAKDRATIDDMEDWSPEYGYRDHVADCLDDDPEDDEDDDCDEDEDEE